MPSPAGSVFYSEFETLPLAKWMRGLAIIELNRIIKMRFIQNLFVVVIGHLDILGSYPNVDFKYEPLL